MVYLSVSSQLSVGRVWKRTAGRTEGEYGLREDLSILSEHEMDMNVSQPGPHRPKESMSMCVCVYVLSKTWCGSSVQGC